MLGSKTFRKSVLVLYESRKDKFIVSEDINFLTFDIIFIKRNKKKQQKRQKKNKNKNKFSIK